MKRIADPLDPIRSQIVNLLVPELQRRGIFWDDYPEVLQPEGATHKLGITAREGLTGVGGKGRQGKNTKHLDPAHYGSRFKWVLDGEEEGEQSGKKRKAEEEGGREEGKVKA